MVYVTGDTHGEFARVQSFCRIMETQKSDILVILGDAGINFSGIKLDKRKKELLEELPITIFAIQGNHDMRPSHIQSCILQDYRGGKVWIDPEYPDILFARDGDIFEFDGYRCLVIGGAYSVDKLYRLEHHWPWFADEQPDDEIKERAVESLRANEYKVDYVFTHTTPLDYMPYLSANTQMHNENWWSTDYSTEEWLQKSIYNPLKERVGLNKVWYAGHHHINERKDNLQILLNHFTILGCDIPFDIYEEIIGVEGVKAQVEISDNEGNYHGYTFSTRERFEASGRTIPELKTNLLSAMRKQGYDKVF